MRSVLSALKVCVVVLILILGGVFFIGRAEAGPDGSGLRVAGQGETKARQEGASRQKGTDPEVLNSSEERKGSADEGKEKTVRRRPGTVADRCNH